MDKVIYRNEQGRELVLTGSLPYVLSSVDGLYPPVS